MSLVDTTCAGPSLAQASVTGLNIAGPGLAELSVAALRRLVAEVGSPPPPELLAALRSDARSQVRAMADTLERRAAAAARERERLEGMRAFERELEGQGFRFIAGVDEAGVGPLVGPVMAGAAILPPGYVLEGLDDSKRISSEERRAELAAEVKRDAVAWSVGEASVEEIDRLNIYHASLLAMRRAVEALTVRPDFVLVDARTIPGVAVPQRGLVGGDAKSLSIAAGAILAKTSRDARLIDLDRRFPGYGFAAHKGYPAPRHLEALRRLGPLPEHRRSFAPVAEALGRGPSSAEAPR